MKLYQHILREKVAEGERVIDLGCGDGEVLDALIKEKGCEGYGVEQDFSQVVAAIQRGLPVYQGDILDGLKSFGDNVFDTAILSQTLQQVMCPIDVMNAMCRVAKRAIVTFPNFGYWRVRLQLLRTGHSPKTEHLPYDWHNTPNIRVITINDFRLLCKENGIKILKEIPLARHKFQRVLFPKRFTNIVMEKGIFIITKQ
jgi:methionine biosynthesis protein MetW